MTPQEQPFGNPGGAPAAPPKKKKNKTFRRLFFLFLLLLWLSQNYILLTPEVTIPSAHVKQPMTIAVLSDLHASILNISDNRLLDAVSSAEPDLICVVGDMYTNGSESSQKSATEFLCDLAAPGTPVYFVPGEHDRSVSYTETLQQNGIHVLNYTTEQITVNENTVTLYGIDNAFFSPSFDLANAFAKPDGNSYSILLAHIPNYTTYTKFGTDLTLCGDTHGGIIQLPGLGPLNYQGNWLPELTAEDTGMIMDKGLFPYNNGAMFITSGIGNYPAVPVRFGNNPEIAILHIQPEA